MRRTMLLTVAVLIGLGGWMTVPDARAAGEGPEAWVDSIASNLSLLKPDGLYSSCRVKRVTSQLKKSGEVKRRSIEYFLLQFDSSGTRIWNETDSLGTITKPGVQVDSSRSEDSDATVDTDEDKKEVSLKVGPFDPFKKEYRDQYVFERAPSDRKNCLEVSYQPKDNEENLAPVVVIVDTTYWVPVSLAGPIDAKVKYVKEMDLALDFEPCGKGHMRLRRTVSTAHAKVVLLHFRFRVSDEYYDYK